MPDVSAIWCHSSTWGCKRVGGGCCTRAICMNDSESVIIQCFWLKWVKYTISVLAVANEASCRDILLSSIAPCARPTLVSNLEKLPAEAIKFLLIYAIACTVTWSARPSQRTRQTHRKNERHTGAGVLSRLIWASCYSFSHSIARTMKWCKNAAASIHINNYTNGRRALWWLSSAACWQGFSVVRRLEDLILFWLHFCLFIWKIIRDLLWKYLYNSEWDHRIEQCRYAIPVDGPGRPRGLCTAHQRWFVPHFGLWCNFNWLMIEGMNRNLNCHLI